MANRIVPQSGIDNSSATMEPIRFHLVPLGHHEDVVQGQAGVGESVLLPEKREVGIWIVVKDQGPASLQPLDRFRAKIFLLFRPHQFRSVLSCLLEHAAIQLVYARAAQRRLRDLAREVPRALPDRASIDCHHIVAQTAKGSAAHAGGLSAAEIPDEEDTSHATRGVSSAAIRSPTRSQVKFFSACAREEMRSRLYSSGWRQSQSIRSATSAASGRRSGQPAGDAVDDHLRNAEAGGSDNGTAVILRLDDHLRGRIPDSRMNERERRGEHGLQSLQLGRNRFAESSFVDYAGCVQHSVAEVVRQRCAGEHRESRAAHARTLPRTRGRPSPQSRAR